MFVANIVVVLYGEDEVDLDSLYVVENERGLSFSKIQF